jgi:S-DNA-T family DNA segregation ATPase FtsK/SpoIIIE
MRLLFARIKGGAIILFAFLLAVAIVAYVPEDASFNAASSGPVQNLFGPWGSLVADMIWQYFGISGIALSIVLSAWGWRVATQRGLDLFWWRSFAALIAILAAGIGIAAHDPSSSLGQTRFGAARCKTNRERHSVMLPASGAVMSWRWSWAFALGPF